MSDTIEIPLSKTKMLLLFLAAAIFVILGIFLVMNSEHLHSARLRNPEIIKILGIISVAFFGPCALFIAKKLFDKKAGLIIDEKGITDNSSATSVGLIEWTDIIGIETLQVASTKFIMLKTKEPEKYIEKAKNKFVKNTMKVNYKWYGSPISISSNSLKIKFKDLEKLINKEFEKSRNLS